MKIYFPHIPRRFSAKELNACLKLAILSALAVIILLNTVTERKNQNILGEQSSSNLRQIKEGQEENLRKELNYWLSFNNKFPDYNYSYLKIADLYFKLDQQEDGNKIMKKYQEVIVESDKTKLN
ncbi:hypothetical protein A2W14_05480 [Candidatus Gottesmanbacteria bacterium RBG_16_37_8]|uniref:Uncharacterized protein n=1 Tax=Candidatus Gottesmanbacteria bacterium RBG_16_37_8 TaxID=1798371 RepID=A0A1F5YUZ4_9BACT|nr:MAG: hypothetical protein A2W14_05480 [Candidatus Gottesmanbacteria bacterium RBG_16_37_8]